jgi:hypothetical protein
LLSETRFLIGTSTSCDCVVTPDPSLASQLSLLDPRDICHIASIHAVISITQPHASSAHTSPSAPSPSDLSVTIVDNHTLWGTYVVSRNGVEKVTTVVTRGHSLHSGDLLCLGLVRNGPKLMSSVDANKALLVFRVRIE